MLFILFYRCADSEINALISKNVQGSETIDKGEKTLTVASTTYKCNQKTTIDEAEVMKQHEGTVASVIYKCKQIAKFFNQSVKMTNLLRQDLKKRNYGVSNVIQEVETRWNSLYAMLERINKILDSINSVLCREKHNLQLLTPDEVDILSEILLLLKPVASITANLSRQKYCTVSLIIPFTKALLTKLENVTVSSPTSNHFKDCLIEETRNRLLSYEDNLCCRYVSLIRFIPLIT